MSYMNLRPKVEDVFYAALGAQGFAVGNTRVEIYRAAEIVAFDKTPNEPCIAIAAAQTRPVEDAGTGQRTSSRVCTLQLAIRTHAEEVEDAANDNAVIASARDAHNELVGQVMDFVCQDNIAAILQATAGAAVAIQQVMMPDETIQPHDRAYETTLTMEVICAPLE